MHQTVYIDVDEEITSILDRVRQETTMDIFLVVPKGAMLLDSIINLKLLKKEAEKMGKVVSIVAPNDNRARTMIERAGIKAEDYNYAMNEQQLQKASIDKNVETEQINKAVSESVRETSQQISQGGLDVGSNSFFAKGRQPQVNNLANQSQTPAKPDVQPINSSGGQESFSQSRQAQSVQPAQSAHQGNSYPNDIVRQSQAEGVQSSPPEGGYQDQNSRNGEANNTYSQDNSRLDYFNGHKNEVTKEEGSSVSTLFKNKFLIIGVIGIVVVLLGAGGWYMANYPKLVLVIEPLSKDVDKEIKLVAKDDTTDINIEDKIIPGEYMEISLEKTIEFDATGSKVVDKNGAKAKGTVTIENSLSGKPQRLVKTTRILSKDGKLFRLTQDVMVPGMKDDNPGKIDATVEADKPGKEFNIGKGEFQIAAWKGTPKGEKFKVSSSSAMTGGVTSADSKTQKVVSKTDLDTARKETLKALDESLDEEIRKRLNPGQSMVQSSVEKEVVSNKASHLADTIANKFSYTVVYKVKVMAFTESDVREIVEGVIQGEIGKNYQLEPGFKMETKRGVVDLDKKTITVYVDVEGISKFEIDETKLKESIAGKNSEDTRSALSKDVGVQSAEIRPSPSWSSKAPSSLDKITVEIVK